MITYDISQNTHITSFLLLSLSSLSALRVCACLCVCVLQVITYLNDEINKWQMGLTGTTGTAALPSYRKYDNKYDANYENTHQREYAKIGDYDYDKYDGKYSNQLPNKAESVVPSPDSPIVKDSSTLIRAPKNSDDFAVTSRKTDVNIISYSPDTMRNKLTYGVAQKNKEDGISNDFISVGVERKNDNNNKNDSDNEKFDKIHTDNQKHKFNQNAEIGRESGRDILLRGIQNLGLGSSFGSLEGLGLDLSLGKEMNENFISVFKDTVKGRIIPEVSTRRSIDNHNIMDSRVKPRSQVKSYQSNLAYNREGSGVKSGSGGGDIKDRRDQKGFSGSGLGVRSKGVDLESLAYYATGNRNNRIQSQ